MGGVWWQSGALRALLCGTSLRQPRPYWHSALHPSLQICPHAVGGPLGDGGCVGMILHSLWHAVIHNAPGMPTELHIAEHIWWHTSPMGAGVAGAGGTWHSCWQVSRSIPVAAATHCAPWQRYVAFAGAGVGTVAGAGVGVTAGAGVEGAGAVHSC